ncbi:hypothetical protein Pla175_01370 [Pirellulimonas nuda]|uniref:Toxin HigB-2 n=1 Tax=Pirellulimonas nuda TaxID=2528009 RepID=A0A518D5N9_9BACT|nr:hypothetical protein [Pirellulimonas nuda]QDU86785.1 hypothetical protein Pla175_01370 [Pirellulimonas nuda]
MRYIPEDGKWQVGPATTKLHELRQQMSDQEFRKNKRALQEFLCGYFSSGECQNALDKSIAPMKATPQGGKVLKVRWAYPGCGKSGGLRLVVVAYCDEKRVHIAQAFDRRDNPSNQDFLDAVSDY